MFYIEPCLHRGVYIAALVCMDASSNAANRGPMKCRLEADKRFLGRVEALRKVPKGHRLVVCIPSRMDQTDSAEVAKYWHKGLPDSVVIVANAPTRATAASRSVIQPEGALLYSESRCGNKLRIVSWPESCFAPQDGGGG